MKTSFAQKTSQSSSKSPSASSGPAGRAITPPTYRIGDINCAPPETAPEPEQTAGTLVQRKAALSAPGSGSRARSQNHTGLPNALKAGVESLSGLSLDDVHVHYNSPKPAQLQALAYAQGTDIHVAPGQERHLPHEAWHIVQQKQGRVRPTGQILGKAINDQSVLEQEATSQGNRASTHVENQPADQQPGLESKPTQPAVVQGKFYVDLKGVKYDVLKSGADATLLLDWIHKQGIRFAPKEELDFWEFAEASRSFPLLDWLNFNLDKTLQVNNDGLLRILQEAGFKLDPNLDKNVAPSIPSLKRRKRDDILGSKYKKKKLETYSGSSLYPQTTQISGEPWTKQVKSSLITKAPEDVKKNYDFGTDPDTLKRPLPSGNYPIGVPVEYHPELLDYSGREDLQAMRHIADLIYNKVRVEEKKKPKKERNPEAEIQLMFIPRFNIMVGSGNKVESANHLEKVTLSGTNVLGALFEQKEEGYGMSRTMPSKYKLGELLSIGSERQEEKGAKALGVVNTAFRSGSWKFLSLLGALKTLRGGTSSQFIFINEPELDQIHAEQKLALLAVLLNKEGILKDTDEVIIAGTKIACRACGTLLPHLKSLYGGITFEQHEHTNIGSGLMWQGTVTEHLDTFDKYIRKTLDPFYSKGGLAGIGFPVDLIDQVRGQVKQGFSSDGKKQKVNISQRPYEIKRYKPSAKKKSPTSKVFEYKHRKKPVTFVRPSSPSPVRPEVAMRSLCISFTIATFEPYNQQLVEAIWPKMFGATHAIDYATMKSFAAKFSLNPQLTTVSNEMESYISSGSPTYDQLILESALAPLENSATCRQLLFTIESSFAGTPPWKTDGDEKWLSDNAGKKLSSVLKLDFANKKFL